MKAPHILVVDNYDSFVFTIVGYLQQLGAECEVVRNDAVSPADGGVDVGTLVRLAVARSRVTRGLTGPRGTYLCSSCRCWHLTSKARVQTPPWVKARSRI